MDFATLHSVTSNLQAMNSSPQAMSTSPGAPTWCQDQVIVISGAAHGFYGFKELVHSEQAGPESHVSHVLKTDSGRRRLVRDKPNHK